jgi:hypothetical protein
MNGVPTSVYDVSLDRKTGWPTGGDAYGHGVLIVVDGVTSIQGERESRSQGEAGQAGKCRWREVEVSEMRLLTPTNVCTGG